MTDAHKSNDDVVRRLRRCRADGPLVNPDGDHAALVILSLQREVKRLTLEFDLASRQAAELRDSRSILLALAKKYASECTDCDGTGREPYTPEVISCEACADIRATIDRAEGRADE